MRKIITIGDIHGSNEWQNIVDEHKEGIDKFVFLGDYVDSFDYSDNHIIENLEDIIEFKKNNMDSVILLLGNHDIQYISDERYSGYRPSYEARVRELFEENIGLFKIFHEEIDNTINKTYLFSHAGVTKDWEERNEDIIDNYFCDGFFSHEELNEIFFNTHDRDIFFQVGASRGGLHKNGSPLWAGLQETMEDGDIGGCIQVVGHTHTATIVEHNNMVYCDTLNYGNKQPYIINIK